MKRILIFIILFISSLQGLYSQIFQDEYNTRQDSLITEGQVYLRLQGSTWFYNNEYFNPFYKGYTLIGGGFQPTIVYQSSPKLQISVGADFLQFYGINEKLRIKPLFSLEYKPNENFSVLMGSYNGGENHKMTEAMFSFENHLRNLVENGILIRFNNTRVKSETWLNWESFIEPGDTFQEAFTAGSSNRIMLFEKEVWNLSLPVCLLAHHSGGQINNNASHIETLINISEGLKVVRNFRLSHFQSAYSEFTFYQNTGDYKPIGGTAISFKTGLQLTHIELNAEYFYGDYFRCFAGNPILSIPLPNSLNPITDPHYTAEREMLNFKAGYKQKIGMNSFLFLRLEGYYFTKTGNLDYSYSLHLQAEDFLKIFNFKRN